MTTVLKPGEPMRDDTHITLVSDDGSHAYGRPTAGNNAGTVGGPDGGAGMGPPATDSDAPAGAVPGYAINWSGADVGTGDTQTAGEVFSGSTLVVAQPDATGHPFGDTSGGGTVGDSGPQQVGPGPTPNSPSGMPDIDNDGDSL